MTRDEAMALAYAPIQNALETAHDQAWCVSHAVHLATEAAATVIQQAFARQRQAGVHQGLDMAKTALEADAKLCDCHAHSEGECACGAWCEWKTITSARAVEIVSKLGGDDAPSK